MLDHLLVNTDWTVLCPVSFRHKGVPERISDSRHYQEHQARVTVFHHDLGGPFSPLQLQELGQVDIIFNFAAQSHVDRSIEDPVPFIRNNVDSVLNMLEFARGQKHLQAFFQVSTDEVYGPAPSGYAHKEWDSIIPSNPYAASKACQEAIAISYWRSYNVPVVLTETMNNIGERQDSEKFVPKIIKCILQGKSVPVHATHGAVSSRFYMHARNHADALLFIAQNTVPGRYPGHTRPDRYHVVGECELDNLELAQRVAAAVGAPLVYHFEDVHSTRPGHDLRYALDGSKLAELGWHPPVSLTAAIQRTVEWTKANPAWLAL